MGRGAAGDNDGAAEIDHFVIAITRPGCRFAHPGYACYGAMKCAGDILSAAGAIRFAIAPYALANTAIDIHRCIYICPSD